MRGIFPPVLIVFVVGALRAQAVPFRGQVSLASDCKDHKTEVFIEYKDPSSLIHQLYVPKNGTFLVDLRPGSYRMSAIGDKGCFGAQLLNVTDQDSTMIHRTLQLEPRTQK